ncbi:hypothetical protein C0J52_00119 [Blattella germanica]|nr:hypothetical protein C0J52_00119 [Blattella germanica]
MANRRFNENVIKRPAGFSSDEDASSDEDGFFFSGSSNYEKPKRESQLLETIESSLTDADHIRLEAIVGDVESLHNLFEKSNLPVDVISQGCTPLMFAATNCNYNAMEFLLRKGANSNFNQGRYTVLMSACDSLKKSQEEQLRCVQLLIKHGADVNAQKKGITPLMIACKTGREQIVAELIHAKANINDRDCMGWTPLMWCVHNANPGQMKTIEVLLNADVDTSITCGKGRTAHSYAVELGFLDVAAKIPVHGTEKVHFASDVNLPTKIDSWQDLRQNLEGTDKKHWNLWQDIARSLHRLGLLRIYGSKFKDIEMDLVKFLTLTDEELESMSVIPVHRKRFLDMTRKLHLKRWKEQSLNVQTIRTFGGTYNMADEVKFIANIARQITIIRASVAYIRLYMESSYEDEKENSTGDDLKKNVEKALIKTKILRKELNLYLSSVRSKLINQKQHSADKIHPVAERKGYCKALLSIGIVVSMLTIFAWKAQR